MLIRNKQAGFTIVELLIVIVVIGILAAITIVAYNGVQGRAYNTSVESDLTAAAKQIELLRVDLERYPIAYTEFPVGFKLTKSAYLVDNSTQNALYCLNRITDSYALSAVSKSGQNYMLHDGVVTKDGNTNVCSVVGTTWKNDSTTAVIHGYNMSTAAWHSAWSWTK